MPGWESDRAGRLVFTGESGIPDPPLATALRAATFSSLIGIGVGVVIALTAVAIGWDDTAGVAALGAFGMSRIRRKYRLRAALALTITTAGCLVAGIILDRWLPAPWDLFIPLALALTIGTLAGTAVTYIPRHTDERPR
ncbi:hypothetical protein AB0M35_28350 [Micromonospora sp. NPDC051196]|uniref:hypothetical protein n=1 Tax=Micromonospora sp. NPDC051196 TaxID=3155281 RepID=UPI003438F537